jgi:hypothetical protein
MGIQLVATTKEKRGDETFFVCASIHNDGTVCKHGATWERKWDGEPYCFLRSTTATLFPTHPLLLSLYIYISACRHTVVLTTFLSLPPPLYP